MMARLGATPMWVLLLVGAAVGAYGWTCVRLLSMLRCRRRQRASRCAWPNPAGAHLDLTLPAATARPCPTRRTWTRAAAPRSRSRPRGGAVTTRRRCCSRPCRASPARTSAPTSAPCGATARRSPLCPRNRFPWGKAARRWCHARLRAAVRSSSASGSCRLVSAGPRPPLARPTRAPQRRARLVARTHRPPPVWAHCRELQGPRRHRDALAPQGAGRHARARGQQRQRRGGHLGVRGGGRHEGENPGACLHVACQDRCCACSGRRDRACARLPPGARARSLSSLTPPQSLERASERGECACMRS